MLKKKFNKFSGTEIRVKRQIPFFIQLLSWMSEKQKRMKSLSISEWNNEYIEWTRKEEIYNYSNGNIKRFGMIKSILDKFGIHYTDKRFNIPSNIDKNYFFTVLQEYSNSNNVKPFLEMLNFAYQNPNINPKKLIYSFIVFDGNEPFNELCEIDVIEKILDDYDDRNLPTFNKPPSSLGYIKKIFEMKMKNEPISVEDFKYYNHSKDNYIKSIVLKPRERFNLSSFVERVNNLSLNDYVRGIRKSQLKNLLEKEYFDLFSRWLFDLGLIDVAGKGVSKFREDILVKTNDTFVLKNQKKELFYPYSLEEVSEFVSSIAQDDFYFKAKREELKKVANSVLAEYFVNLYYAYMLRIEPIEFKKYANTKISDELYPVFTAPGGVADMQILLKHSIINVETTLHNRKQSIQKNEIFPCINHFKPDNHLVKNSYLIFISLLDPSEYSKYFKTAFDLDHPNSNLIMTTFDNLIIPEV